MLRGEKRYCDFCQGPIACGQKHVQIRPAPSKGKQESDYRHYHYRFPGDCWACARRPRFRRHSRPFPVPQRNSNPDPAQGESLGSDGQVQ